ncbi:hypothetical protein B6S12_02075 [Helicobacter valdiviensis]|uniref:DUF4153 domain-containing protein n=1 Tax=Helicobacter valdiviensis TaxID=1458358 RepID=A0A2W6MWI0_9HELI|nr:DUF4153 domain-containing protein [Helicobacter valdiviensis]PZT48854.1 hypothetical protein B6S12_02075 [Helicobacter valdiviensis]
MKVLFKNAFMKYPLSLFVYALFCLFLLSFVDEKTFFLSSRFTTITLVHFFTFMMAFTLFLETFVSKYYPQKNKKIEIFITILISIVVYFLLFDGIYTEKGMNFREYKIALYDNFFIANGLIFTLIFAFLAVSIKESYEIFSTLVMRFLFVLSLYLLCLILLGILLAGSHFLLSIDSWRGFNYLAIIFGFIAGVAFLGMQERISYSKALKIVLLIFDIFAFSYIILLLLYFIAPIRSFDSIVHIVMWFGFFVLNLAFVNRGIRGQNKIFSFYAIVALLLSIIALWAIFLRLSEYSFTPSRIFVLTLSFYIFCASLLYFTKRGLFFSLILASILALLSSNISLPLSLRVQSKIFKELSFNLSNEENFIKAYGKLEKESFNTALRRCEDVADFLNSYRGIRDRVHCKVGINKSETKEFKTYFKSHFLHKRSEIVKFDDYEMIDLDVHQRQSYGAYTFKLQEKSLLMGYENTLVVKIPLKDLLREETKTYKTKEMLISIKPTYINLKYDYSDNIKEIDDFNAFVFIKHINKAKKKEQK